MCDKTSDVHGERELGWPTKGQSEKLFISRFKKASLPFRLPLMATEIIIVLLLPLWDFYLRNWISLGFVGSRETRIKWPSSTNDWYPNRSQNEDEHLSHLQSSRSEHSGYFAIIQSSLNVRWKFARCLNVFRVQWQNFPQFDLICDRCGRKSTADGKLKIFALKVFMENRKIRQQISKNVPLALWLGIWNGKHIGSIIYAAAAHFHQKLKFMRWNRRKVFHVEFSFYRFNLEAGNVLTFIRRLLRLGMKSRRKVEAFERQPNE